MFIPRSVLFAAAVAALGVGRVLGQCNCSCDSALQACEQIVDHRKNESGQDPTQFVTAAGPGGTNVEVRHANRFTFGNTLISHVCISLRDPSAAAGDVAEVFFAADAAGLPGGMFGNTPFVVSPTTFTTQPHQIVALPTPQTLNGTVWVGVRYPTAQAAIPHQGVRAITGGSAAVWVGGPGAVWQNYNAIPAFVGLAPIIRPVRIVLNPQIDVLPTCGASTSEDGWHAIYEVRLRSGVPTQPVTINWTSGDPSEGIPQPASMVFTSTASQYLHVVGVEDAILDGAVGYQILGGVSTLDACYGALVVPALSLSNQDNDGACGARAWSSPSVTNPPGAMGSASAYDSWRGMTLRVGGDMPSAGGVVASAHGFDGNTWAFLASAPVAWTRASMAFDSLRGRAILAAGFDGVSVPPLAEAYSWDGTSWAPLPPIPVPGRYSGAMAYDSGRDRVVYFGGTNGLAWFGDTWEFDGAAWAPVPAVVAPSARAEHCMAYNEASGRVVLYGGFDGAAALSDAWEFDGVQWLPAPAPGPGERRDARLAYDPTTRACLLFGGRDTGGLPSAELWSYDGACWTQMHTPMPGITPDGRSAHVLEFDRARGTLVLAAGELGPGVVAGDTWHWQRQNALMIAPLPGSFQMCSLGTFTLAGTHVGGGVPFAYQWYRDGVALVNGPTIAGADAPVLTVGPTLLTDSGAYQVRVSSACGPALSNVCQVAISCPDDIDDDGDPTNGLNPDGAVDINDLLSFLTEFSLGSLSVDLDDGNFGCVPDGGVDINDLLFFLAHFQAGC